METFQILSDQFNHFQHLFHRWLAIFFIISSYIFDLSSSPHTWGILSFCCKERRNVRFIPTYVGHTVFIYLVFIHFAVHPHIRGAYDGLYCVHFNISGSSPHTWGIHWIAVRKMAGFSHFSYDFIRKSYFVQGLVFFGVIGAEAFPTHRRGRSQCLPESHGGSGLGRRSVTCPDSGTP